MTNFMKALDNPWLAGAVVSVCVAVIYLANTGAIFGKLINIIFPCAEGEAGASMPCYAKYDIAIMFVAAIMAGVFLLVFLRSLLPAMKMR